jgi:hypothetical protein
MLIRIVFWAFAGVFIWGVYDGVNKDLIAQSIILALLSIACLFTSVKLVPFMRKSGYKV